MKKIFVAIVALAATACSNDNIISIDRQTIGFGNPFVNNSVRADYSAGKSLEAFTVYGTVTGNSNTVALFGGNGASVTGEVGDNVWECDETEYWVPNCSYSFQAVADGTIADGKIAVSVGDGDIDLLYAKATATTNEKAEPAGDVNANGVVPFTFTHLMSKVGFEFKNGSANTAYGYNITAVSFTGHDTEGTYTIGGAWDSEYTAAANDAALDFSAGSATHQIIPGEQTLNVTVAYDIVYKDKTISSTSFTKPLKEYNFEESKSYCIVVTIPAPGKEIQFKVEEIAGWVEGNSEDLKI